MKSPGGKIGFGMGEFLVRCATDSPNRNFVGLEQHWERIYKTLRRLERSRFADPGAGHPDNIKILRIDARVAFERLFSPRSIDVIYCLFPCPWPKKGHVKHRLFSKKFLRLLNSRLKAKGMIKIVTDFFPYYEWMLTQIPTTGFDAATQTTQPQYGTKFERKWCEEGQKEFFELLEGRGVDFAYFEAFDQPWKNSLQEEPFWGLHHASGRQKLFLSSQTGEGLGGVIALSYSNASGDEPLMFLDAGDGTMRVVDEGEFMKTYSSSRVNRFAWSPDGNTLAYLDDDKIKLNIKLFNQLHAPPDTP